MTLQQITGVKNIQMTPVTEPNRSSSKLQSKKQSLVKQPSPKIKSESIKSNKLKQELVAKSPNGSHVSDSRPLATPDMFYKKNETINNENEEEIVDIDEDDGIDSDVLPQSVI